jgi:hypothetical protein
VADDPQRVVCLRVNLVQPVGARLQFGYETIRHAAGKREGMSGVFTEIHGLGPEDDFAWVAASAVEQT